MKPIFKTIQHSILLLLIITLCIFQFKNLYYGGTVLAFFGSIFLESVFIVAYLGLWKGIQNIQHYRNVVTNGRKTKATIKGYHEMWYRTKNYHLLLVYKDAQNNSHQICSSESLTFLTKKYRKGNKLSIAYLEDDPEHPILIPAYFYCAIMEITIFGLFATSSLAGTIVLLII